MQSIGERLQEARKKQGLTLREVSEATKIRADFLGSFENNDFEISLPEIYRRGFLKIYASFLKLDANRILLDYSAQSGSTPPTRNTRNAHHLGRMEAEQKDSPATQSSFSKPSFRPNAAKAKKSEIPQDGSPKPENKVSLPKLAGDPDNDFILKISLVVGAGLVAIILFIAIVVNLTRTDPADAPQTPPALADAQPATPRTAPPANPNPVPTTPAAAVETFSILASGSVSVWVKEIQTDREIYRGTLNAGERLDLRSQGPARITYSNGEFIRIVKDGRTYQAAPNSFAMRTNQF